MRLFTQTIAFALALCAPAVIASTATTCKMLTDKDSLFISSVAQLNGVSPEQLAAMPLEDVLAPVDDNFPWFSKCVANVDLVDVVMAMSTSTEVGQCIQALEASSELAFPPDAAFSDAFFSDSFCPVVVDTAVPCLNDVFLPVLARALNNAGGCCSDMNAVIAASFGSNLQQLTTTLSKLVANAICSVKTATNTVDVGEVAETCGYSLISNFIGQASSDLELLVVLAAAVQIPEESVCNAVEGKQFQTTTGGSAEFAARPGSEPYGICYATMQNLVSYVKAFPIWSTLVVETDVAPWVQKLSDLFKSGTCVRGDYLLKWVLDEDSVVMKAVNLLDGLGAAMSIQPEDPATPVFGSTSVDAEVSVEASESGSGSASEQTDVSSSSISGGASESVDGGADESGGVSESASASAGSTVINSASESADGSANATASTSASASESASEEQKEPSTTAPVASDASGSSAVSIASVSFESQAVSQDALIADDDQASAMANASLSTATIIRESLSAFVEPLAVVCIHFPSVKVCEFGEDELAFAFSDVGRVMTIAKTPAASSATAASTTTSTMTTTIKSMTSAPITDAPASATTGGASAAVAASRQTGLAAVATLCAAVLVVVNLT